MTELYFVRHAEPDYENHDDMSRPLTEKGMRDRLLAADFLSDKDISAVYSSPFKRAVDTVQPLADRLNLPVLTDADFRERKVDSVWVEDFDAFSRQQWSDFDYRLTDGETLRTVEERNFAAVQRVLKSCPDAAVAIGSHGTALSTLIHRFDKSFGYDAFQAIKRKMPWIVRFTFEGETCVKITEYDVFTGAVHERTPDILK